MTDYIAPILEIQPLAVIK